MTDRKQPPPPKPVCWPSPPFGLLEWSVVMLGLLAACYSVARIVDDSRAGSMGSDGAKVEFRNVLLIGGRADGCVVPVEASCSVLPWNEADGTDTYDISSVVVGDAPFYFGALKGTSHKEAFLTVMRDYQESARRRREEAEKVHAAPQASPKS